MTFLEAAIEVLRRENEPLHFSEIARRAVERKLLSHVGRDPVAAMQVNLNAAVRGESALIVRARPGYYQVRPGAELPPEPAAATAPAVAAVPTPAAPPAPAPAAPAAVVAPAAPAAVPPVVESEDDSAKNLKKVESRKEVPSMQTQAPREEPAGEEDVLEEGGRRRRRRRDRFGVRGEAPAPQQIAVKPSRRGADPARRTEVLQRTEVVQKAAPTLEFEAPRGAGLDGVTDVALVMANAMSRLAEERPELRSEFESLQRAPATPPPAPVSDARPPRRGPAPAPARPLDEEERGGRRRRRRRRRGRREGGAPEIRGAGDEVAAGLLQHVAQVLEGAGSRSLHVRQIAETLAGQGVHGGEISEIERAVTAALLLDLRAQGRASRFVARGDARYQLQSSRTPPGLVAAEQALHAAVRAVEAETIQQLSLWLQTLGPRGLESLVRVWLELEGYPLLATLPPSRGVAKLVVGDVEGDEEEEGKLLVLVFPRKASLDPSAWSGDLERMQAAGTLVFVMAEVPAEAPWGDARVVGAGELAAWMCAHGVGVTAVPVAAAVLDPAQLESIGGLDT